jgi:hypothetical protein
MEQHGNNMEIEKRLDKIEQILERFESALFGDKFNGNNGHLQRMDRIENRLDLIEKYNAAQKWFLFGAGATGGAGLVKVLESFFQQ